LDTYGILEQKDIDTEIMNIIPEKHRANFKINFELDYSLQIE